MATYQRGFFRQKEFWSEENRYFIKLKKVIERYFQPNITVCYNNFHGDDCVTRLELDEKRLNIVGWFYEGNNKEKTSAYSRELSSMGLLADNTFVNTQREDEITFVYNGIPLAVYNKTINVIWLLWDASHDECSEMIIANCKMIDKALEYFALSRVNDSVFNYDATKSERNGFAFNKTVNGLQIITDNKIRQLQSEIDNISNEIDTYRRRLADYNSKRNERIESMGRQKEKVCNETVINNVYVKHIEVNRGVISIYTDHIYVTDFDHDRFESLYSGYEIVKPDNCGWYIGTFLIKINMNNWNFSFTNLNNRRQSHWSSRDMHPHIGATSGPCMGTLSEMVGFAQSNGDIPTMIDVFIQFLQSVNLGDTAGRRISNWDLVNFDNNTYFDMSKTTPEWKPFIQPGYGYDFDSEGWSAFDED